MAEERSKWRIKILDDVCKEDIPENVRFLLGTSVRAFASTIVQPIDVIKIRIQLCISVGLRKYPTTLRGIIAKEGISVLFYGISAGVLKQVMAATTRLGVYSVLFHYFRTGDDKFPGFGYQVAIEIFTVGCGAFVATPAEVALVRMTADTCNPKHRRANYKHAIDALKRIHRKEGITSLWTGAVPMVMHAVFAKTTDVLLYPTVEHNFMANGNTLPLHIIASMIVQFMSSIVALPLDIIKTKLQSMKVKNGVYEFKGPLDALRKIVKQETIFVLWKGFIPYYMRRTVHTLLTITMLEYSYTLCK